MMTNLLETFKEDTDEGNVKEMDDSTTVGAMPVSG